MRWTQPRGRSGLLAITAMLGTLLMLVTPVVVPAASATAGAGAQTQAETAWGACPALPAGRTRDPREQCTTVRVPLDYRKPHGRTIGIAVSRIATAAPETRRGILLFNPGGPGGAGLDMPSVLVQRLPTAVLGQYDLIGFDPRGVANSAPVTCAIPPGIPYELYDPYPAPDGSITANITFGWQLADGCTAESGAELPFITTANTARDMDRIRIALGEHKLSYMGWAYGTYLGAVYNTLFPQRRDRMVLDGVIDPTLVWREARLSWGKAVTDRFPDLTRYVAAHPELGLGGTEAEVTARYYALAERLDDRPVTLPNSQVLTGNLFRWSTWVLLFSNVYFPRAGQLWNLGAAAAEGASTPEGLATLVQILDFLGALVLYPPLGPGIPVDNGVASHYAVMCNDRAWPRDTAEYARDVAQDRAAWPLMAGMPANVVPCTYWNHRSIESPVRVKDSGDRGILILQNRRDPAMSWEAALGMRRTLSRTAAFVGVDAGGSGSFGLGSCADAIALTFLATGALPGEDTYCALPTV